MIASILEQDTVFFEHKDAKYAIHRLGPQDWTITTEAGRGVGSLTIVSPEGEEGEPVYGGIIAGQTETDYEGSDWESIVRAIVNEALEAEDEAALAAGPQTAPAVGSAASAEPTA